MYTESRFQSFVKKVVFMSLQVWNDDAMYWIRGTSACLAVVIKSKNVFLVVGRSRCCSFDRLHGVCSWA